LPAGHRFFYNIAMQPIVPTVPPILRLTNQGLVPDIRMEQRRRIFRDDLTAFLLEAATLEAMKSNENLDLELQKKIERIAAKIGDHATPYLVARYRMEDDNIKSLFWVVPTDVTPNWQRHYRVVGLFPSHRLIGKSFSDQDILTPKRTRTNALHTDRALRADANSQQRVSEFLSYDHWYGRGKKSVETNIDFLCDEDALIRLTQFGRELIAFRLACLIIFGDENFINRTRDDLVIQESREALYFEKIAPFRKLVKDIDERLERHEVHELFACRDQFLSHLSVDALAVMRRTKSLQTIPAYQFLAPVQKQLEKQTTDKRANKKPSADLLTPPFHPSQQDRALRIFTQYPFLADLYHESHFHELRRLNVSLDPTLTAEDFLARFSFPFRPIAPVPQKLHDVLSYLRGMTTQDFGGLDVVKSLSDISEALFHIDSAFWPKEQKDWLSLAQAEKLARSLARNQIRPYEVTLQEFSQARSKAVSWPDIAKNFEDQTGQALQKMIHAFTELCVAPAVWSIRQQTPALQGLIRGVNDVRGLLRFERETEKPFAFPGMPYLSGDMRRLKEKLSDSFGRVSHVTAAYLAHLPLDTLVAMAKTYQDRYQEFEQERLFDRHLNALFGLSAQAVPTPPPLSSDLKRKELGIGTVIAPIRSLADILRLQHKLKSFDPVEVLSDFLTLDSQRHIALASVAAPITGEVLALAFLPFTDQDVTDPSLKYKYRTALDFDLTDIHICFSNRKGISGNRLNEKAIRQDLEAFCRYINSQQVNIVPVRQALKSLRDQLSQSIQRMLDGEESVSDASKNMQAFQIFSALIPQLDSDQLDDRGTIGNDPRLRRLLFDLCSSSLKPHQARDLMLRIVS
jgi:hypothetical protein